MRVKHLFGILVLLLVVIAVLLLFSAAGSNDVLFFVIEGTIVLTIVFLSFLYNKLVKPLNTIASGMDLLKEQDFSSRLKPVRQKEADRIVEIFNRMMDRLKEERLHTREQNHFLDLLIDVSPMGVVVLDLDGRISSCNDAALKFLDITADDAPGKTLDKVDSRLAQAICNIGKDSSETVRLGNGMIYRCSRLSFIDRGFHHPFILIESLTDEVFRAEKKAYEKVIRMIAHEVNNTVGGITSSLDTVRQMLQGADDAADIQEVMTVCMERSMSMSRFITNFADVVKIPEPQLKNENLNDVITSSKVFIEALRKDKHIRFEYRLSDTDVCVNIDRVLFEQVLVNIVKNAVESIASEGTIIISTSAHPLELVIADDGEIIEKDVEEKLFSPFFSTKPAGQGIGLLFIREVLVRHCCAFSLRSYPDGMTRFRISFDDKQPRK